MRKLVPFLILIVWAPFSVAWDSDVHMKMLYALCRKAGIGPEVCLKLSLYSGWAAETEGSDPNSPAANAVLYRGFQRGDLQVVGAGLRHLMDSFTQDYPAGKDAFGRWPNRPWFYLEVGSEGVYNPRFKNMVPVVFTALCALRDLLPDIAKDKAVALSDGQLAYQANAAQLAQDFTALERYKEISTWKTTSDRRYVVPAIRFLLNRSKQRGIIKENFKIESVQAIIPKPEDAKPQDAFDVFVSVVDSLITSDLNDDQVPGQIFNMAAFNRDIAYWLKNPADMTPAEFDVFVLNTARKLAQGHLPIGPGRFDEEEVESEGTNRNLEMDLRHRAWDSFIEKEIGSHESFEFVKPPVGLHRIFEIFCSTTGDWCITRKGEVTKTQAISISGWERLRWNWAMGGFFFRSSGPKVADGVMGYQSPSVWEDQKKKRMVRSVLGSQDVVSLMADRLASLQRQQIASDATVSCSQRLAFARWTLSGTTTDGQ